MRFRASIGILFLTAAMTSAADEERRTFSVRVDNRPAGGHVIVIQKRDDGTQVVAAQADVLVKVGFLSFRYAFRGQEVWKEGKLLSLATVTDDDGKKHSVAAEANKDGFIVKADGKTFQTRADIWVTTYWKLPPENQRAANMILFDADTGKVIRAQFDKIGVEKLTLLGKEAEYTHYRLSGGVKVDLWFDGADRLVRQESIEDGHRTVLELTRLQKE